MKKPDKLKKQIEDSLVDLLSGKSKKSKEEKDELRQTLSLAIKWQSVTQKKTDEGWGTGFKNGEAKGEDDEPGIGDD